MGRSCLGVLLVLSGLLSSAWAQTLPLPELSAPPFKPLPETLVADRVVTLNRVLDQLETRLTSAADPAGWRSYFGLEALRKQLSTPETFNPRSLAAILPQFYSNHARCEWPQVRDVRTHLVALIAALETAGIPDLEAEYYARTERLQQLVQAHTARPDSGTSLEIARQLHWMRHARQGSSLIKQVRQYWAQPNFLAEVRLDTLLPRELDELVTDRSPVVDNILGTDIRGQALTRGRVSMQLVPSRDSGLFELTLRGTTVANTTGVNGPATLKTTSHSTFTAVTRVRITDEGLIYDPPQASAVTNSNTHDLQVPRRFLSGVGEGRSRLIERIARKKADELKPQADAIAARRSETRYEKSMAQYVEQALEKTNQPFREKLRGPLLRMGALYESLGFSTTTEAVQMKMLYANGLDLGADTAPPTFASQHSLALKIHESCLRNAAHMLLRGTTLSDRSLARFMKGAFGEIPREAREFRLGSHLERWSITVADEHPVLVDFDPAGSTVGLRIQAVTIGEQTTPVNLLVRAKYRIDFTPHGPRLTRLGGVEVVNDLASPDQPSTDVLKLVHLKASNFLIPEIWFDALVPPAGGPFDKYAHLSFRELIVENGWLALGFDQSKPQAGEKTASKAKQPSAVR